MRNKRFRNTLISAMHSPPAKLIAKNASAGPAINGDLTALTALMT